MDTDIGIDMCVYIYIYTYTPIHMYIDIDICIYICIHVYIYTPDSPIYICRSSRPPFYLWVRAAAAAQHDCVHSRK